MDRVSSLRSVYRCLVLAPVVTLYILGSKMETLELLLI